MALLESDSYCSGWKHVCIEGTPPVFPPLLWLSKSSNSRLEGIAGTKVTENSNTHEVLPPRIRHWVNDEGRIARVRSGDWRCHGVLNDAVLIVACNE